MKRDDSSNDFVKSSFGTSCISWISSTGWRDSKLGINNGSELSASNTNGSELSVSCASGSKLSIPNRYMCEFFWFRDFSCKKLEHKPSTKSLEEFTLWTRSCLVLLPFGKSHNFTLPVESLLASLPVSKRSPCLFSFFGSMATCWENVVGSPVGILWVSSSEWSTGSSTIWVGNNELECKILLRDRVVKGVLCLLPL